MPNTLNDENWNRLLERIKEGECIPFLGAGACFGKIPLGSHFATEWAESYNYPLEERHDLTKVAQFLAVKKDTTCPKQKICDEIKKSLQEVKLQDLEAPEIHGLLATLPLPVYITTNYDDLIFKALESHGKKPKRFICQWNKEFQQAPLESNFVPTKEEPLVFYLHGFYETPMSIVITEDDYVKMLESISSPSLLPTQIQEALRGASLLFLGYSMNDWDFKVIFEQFRYFGGDLSRIGFKKSTGKVQVATRGHISVQLVPGEDRISESQKEEAQKYLNNYFIKRNISVYWGKCDKFAEELREHLEGYSKEETGEVAEPEPRFKKSMETKYAKEWGSNKCGSLAKSKITDKKTKYLRLGYTQNPRKVEMAKCGAMTTKKRGSHLK